MSIATSSIDRFLLAWDEHQRLRATGAPIAVLSASRARLDRLRLDAYTSVNR